MQLMIFMRERRQADSLAALNFHRIQTLKKWLYIHVRVEKCIIGIVLISYMIL